MANEKATSGVQRATEVVEEAINGLLQQEDQEEVSLENDEGEENIEPIAEVLAVEPGEAKLPPLPEMFAWRLQGLVGFLQAEAGKLAASDSWGQEAVWTWWEHHFAPIRDAILQLEYLEEKAVADEMSLLPYIDQMGGVPVTVLADQWPAEMVLAAEEWEESEEASEDAVHGSEEREWRQGPAVVPEARQRALFGEGKDEEDEQQVAVVNLGLSQAQLHETQLRETKLHETNGHATKSVASDGELVDLVEESNQAPVAVSSEEPPVSESQESQARGMDSFDSNHRPPEQSDSTAQLPLSEAIHEPFGFADRVAYAKHCLLADDTDHRDFDTCFEMYDAEFVVVRLLQLGQGDSELMQRLQAMGWDDVAGTDSEDFLPLSVEELTHRARKCVEAHLVGQGNLNPEFADKAHPENEAPPSKPYSFDDWQVFHDRIEKGDLTAEQLQLQFQQLVAHEEPVIEALIKDHNAKQLKDWCIRWGRHHQSTKKANANTIYQAMLGTFALGQTISYRPFDGETYSDAVARAIEAITEADIAKEAASRQAVAAAHEKAITNPETVDQWRFYVRHHGGYQNLSPEQKVAFEQVNADATRAMRADRKQKTISKLELDEDLTFSMKEGYHDVKEKPLWIVQLSQRVERDTYKDLKAKAKELGGWFSSFKAEDAGFQFYDEAAARLFTELLDGDVDNVEVNAARKIRKMENASERFSAVADTLERNCQEILTTDETKLKNTVRRADMAAGMREDAQRGLASVKTLRALADQLASGQIKYLDGVNAATQLTTITKLLRNGKLNRIRHELAAMREGDRSGYNSHLRHEAMLEEPLCTEDIAHAEYPYPYIYKGHLEDAFTKLGNTPGVKMITRRMQKLLKKADPEKESVAFKNSRAVELLADFLRRAKAAGYECYWFDCCLEDYNRLHAANIHNVFELRTAMRELLPYVAHPEGDDPVVKAEQDLIGKKLSGFFPTPKPVIYEMLELADIQGTDTVLEPSVGKGDLLDAIRQAHPDVDLKGIEYNRTLRDVLVAKGYGETVEFGDFLEQEGEYDRILMNPPFEQMAEIEHVRHAFDLLSEGGRLVSVMSRGPFFRSDAKSREFREWLDGLDHDVEELPEDTFRGVEAFRQTGVQTCLVTINKS